MCKVVSKHIAPKYNGKYGIVKTSSASSVTPLNRSYPLNCQFFCFNKAFFDFCHFLCYELKNVSPWQLRNILVGAHS